MGSQAGRMVLSVRDSPVRLRSWDARDVVRLLGQLDSYCRGERYRVSLELRQRAWLKEGQQ